MLPGFGGVAGGIVRQPAGDGTWGGGGRCNEGQPGTQRVPLLLLQPVAPDPERLPPIGAAVRQDRLPLGAQVVLELLELSRRRALQLHVIQPFQDEGGFFTIGREQGVERILGLVEVPNAWGPAAAEKEALMGVKGGTEISLVLNTVTDIF